tara:strand:- start:2688 stop:2906 length:219 start_codon:yes stop_codon:yes gene_type:complete
MKTKLEKIEQVQKLIKIVDDRLCDLKALKGGWIMTNKVFRLVLKEHPEIYKEWNTLHDRKEALKRLRLRLPN